MVLHSFSPLFPELCPEAPHDPVINLGGHDGYGLPSGALVAGRGRREMDLVACLQPCAKDLNGNGACTPEDSHHGMRASTVSGLDWTQRVK